MLAQAHIGQGLVVGVTGPPHVETDHAKQPRQPTEVDIDDEARITQRQRPQPGRGPDDFQSAIDDLDAGNVRGRAILIP